MKYQKIYLRKMKRYYTEAAMIALLCVPSIVQAMDRTEDEMRVESQPFLRLATELEKKGDPGAAIAYHLAYEGEMPEGQNISASRSRSAQVNDEIMTAKQLRKILKNSPGAVPEKFKQYIQECKVQKNRKEFISVEGKPVFILLGSIVGVSDINKNIAKSQKSSIFCIYSDYFLFDADLKKPGETFFLEASHWFVTGKRTINLQGENGTDHELQKAANGVHPGDPRNHGLIGNDGKPGGHFYGRGTSFDNLESLTINVSGGKGGKGQDGGDGANGADGLDGHPGNLIEAAKNNTHFSEALISKGDLAYGNDAERGFKKAFTLGNEKFRVIFRSGTLGQNGGNAGAGGKGGPSGQKGSIIIKGVNSKNCRTIEEEKVGQNGTSGNPGQGGLHGTIFQRTYIDERVCPGARNMKNVDADSAKEVGIAIAEIVPPLVLAPFFPPIVMLCPVIAAIKGLGAVISAGAHSDWENNATQFRLPHRRAFAGNPAIGNVEVPQNTAPSTEQNTILKSLNVLQQAHTKKHTEIGQSIGMALTTGEVSPSDVISLNAYKARKDNLSTLITELKGGM